MRRVTLAACALALSAVAAAAQTQNQLTFYSGLGAAENIGGKLYPQASITASNLALKPIADGNIRFTTGSLPNIQLNEGEIEFIPAGFHASDGATAPACQFQMNYNPILAIGPRNLQQLAGGVANIYSTVVSQSQEGDWLVDVKFTFEADYAVTGTASQAPWKLNFLCWAQ